MFHLPESLEKCCCTRYGMRFAGDQIPRGSCGALEQPVKTGDLVAFQGAGTGSYGLDHIPGCDDPRHGFILSDHQELVHVRMRELQKDLGNRSIRTDCQRTGPQNLRYRVPGRSLHHLIQGPHRSLPRYWDEERITLSASGLRQGPSNGSRGYFHLLEPHSLILSPFPW